MSTVGESGVPTLKRSSLYAAGRKLYSSLQVAHSAMASQESRC